MSDLVLVAGATGGVGQLTVAFLLEKGFLVRVLTRSFQKAQQMFDNQVEIALGDIRQAETLPSAVQNVTHIICCTGTTAFPSARWEFDLPQSNKLQRLIEWGKIYFNADYRNSKARNSPHRVDAQGVRNLVDAAPKNVTLLHCPSGSV